MALLGAFYWAIQGTGGYGGAPGGTYAGLGFGLLWLYFSHDTKVTTGGAESKTRSYSSGWVLFAIVMGLAIGGTVGFGIYASWIQGEFHVVYQGETVPMTEEYRGWVGYFLTGFQWGGITGILIAFTGAKKPLSVKNWVIRIIFGVLGGAVAYFVITQNLSWFLPLYNEGYYNDFTLYPMSLRVYETVVNVGVLWGDSSVYFCMKPSAESGKMSA